MYLTLLDIRYKILTPSTPPRVTLLHWLHFVAKKKISFRTITFNKFFYILFLFSFLKFILDTSWWIMQYIYSE
jgi:hypothetical protein